MAVGRRWVWLLMAKFRPPAFSHIFECKINKHIVLECPLAIISIQTSHYYTISKHIILLKYSNNSHTKNVLDQKFKF